MATQQKAEPMDLEVWHEPEREIQPGHFAHLPPMTRGGAYAIRLRTANGWYWLRENEAGHLVVETHSVPSVEVTHLNSIGRSEVEIRTDTEAE